MENHIQPSEEYHEDTTDISLVEFTERDYEIMDILC